LVADVALVGLRTAGKEIRLPEVGEVMITVGGLMEKGADGGVAMASAFGFGGGRDGVVCEVFDASSGFSFGARIDGVDRPASSVARALSELVLAGVEDDATVSALEVTLELRKRLREDGGERESSGVGDGGGFSQVLMARRASSRLLMSVKS